MNKKQIVEKLVKIANDLDVLDLSNESDQLTKVAEKVLLAEIEYSPDFNPDYEADDLMATFSVKQSGPIRIVTGDRDLFQLVDDKRDVKVVYLAKGISNHDLVDLDWIQKKYQIPGDRYALFAMIRGDSSDGLPGIKGIGEKGAANIANLFSSLPEVVNAAQGGDERLSANIKKKILEALDYARIAPKLVGCALDVPIPEMNISLPSKPQSMKKIRELQQEFGLGASIERIISALGWQQ